jgi:hypothetical protein
MPRCPLSPGAWPCPLWFVLLLALGSGPLDIRWPCTVSTGLEASPRTHTATVSHDAGGAFGFDHAACPSRLSRPCPRPCLCTHPKDSRLHFSRDRPRLSY